MKNVEFVPLGTEYR